MPGKTIGLVMPNGYAGSYARQSDMIIDSHPLGGDANVVFGTALIYNDLGQVIPAGETATAAEFVGVAAREIKSAIHYLDQSVGQYTPGEAVSVFKRGCVNVVCNVGTPVLGGGVYLRTKPNASIPTGIVGGFEAQADGTNTVLLTSCQWHGTADPHKVAEVRLLTCNRA